MAALVRSSSRVNNRVPPKGMVDIVYGEGSFLQALSHEGLDLLMQVYLHYTESRRPPTNWQLMQLNHRRSSLGLSGHAACSDESEAEG